MVPYSKTYEETKMKKGRFLVRFHASPIELWFWRISIPLLFALYVLERIP